MANNNATFTIVTQVLNKGKGFGMLKADLEAFQKELATAVAESRKFNAKAINFAALSQGFQGIGSAVNQLNQAFTALTKAYSAQIEVETQLAQVMRNTMGATDADIQAIKDLCSAQQALGVVGDEVQLAGAQELATYVTKRETLEKLIPAMNDMVAQQYGYNASAESTVSIATMLGKVMNGQVSALSRYGYSFNDVQAAILKTGTESERAAVLFEVVEESVGGVNAALSTTAMGGLKQFSNAMGDQLETLGSFVVKAMPVITALSTMTMGIAGAGQLIASLKACQGIIAGVNIKLIALKSMALLSGQSLATITAGANTSAVSLRAAAAACGTLKLALRGLLASTVIGVLLAALSVAAEELFESLTGAADAVDNLTDAQRHAAQAESRTRSAVEAGSHARQEAAEKIEIYIARLEGLNGSRAQEATLIDELNSTYGTIFGTYNTAADWLNTLRENSEKYCRQLEIQAQLQAMAANVADLERQKRDLYHNADGSRKELSDENEFGYTSVTYTDPATGQLIPNGRQRVERPGTSELAKANAESARIEAEIAATRARMQELLADMPTIAPVAGEIRHPETSGFNPGATKLEDVENNIKFYQEKLKGATIDTAPAINAEIGRWQALAQAIREAGNNTADLAGADFARDFNLIDITPDATITAKADNGRSVPEFDEQATTLGAILDNISLLRSSLMDMTAEQAGAINDQISHWESLASAIENATEKSAEMGQSARDTCSMVNSAFSMMGSAIGNIGAATDGAAGAWLDYAGGLMGSIGEMIQAIIALATAKSIEASQTGTPFPLNIIALAASMTAVTAAAMKIPKFADGGIAYGPTLGLFGEYAGASTNPEVVAPLDKLQSMLVPSGAAAIPETIKVVADGGDLVAVINTRANRLRRR